MNDNDDNQKIYEETLKSKLKWKHFESPTLLRTGNHVKDYKYSNSETECYFRVKTIKYDIKNDDEENMINKKLHAIGSLNDDLDSAQYFPLYYGYVKYRKTDEETQKKKYYFSLVFEIENGNLLKLIQKRKKRGLSFQENLNLIESIVNGLNKMEEKKIFHENLNPENIFYYQEGETIKFKLFDFKNLSRKSLDLNYDDYAPPEYNYSYYNNMVISRDLFNPFISDIYSLGLILIFANSGKLPFSKHLNSDDSLKYKRSQEKKIDPWEEDEGPYDENIQELIEEIEQKFEKEAGIKEFKKIIEKSLKYNPNNRITLKEIRNRMRDLMENMIINVMEKQNNEKSLNVVENLSLCKRKTSTKSKHNNSKQVEEEQKEETRELDRKVKQEEKCSKCKERQNIEKIIKMECCDKKICKFCLGEEFASQWKEAEELSNSKEKDYQILNFTFICLNCEKEIDNEDFLSTILTKKQFQSYQLKVLEKKHCKKCKRYRSIENVVTLSSCEHNICLKCMKKVILNASNKTLLCPIQNCGRIYRKDMEYFDEFKDFSYFVSNIERSESLNKKSQIVEESKTEEISKYLCKICFEKVLMDDMITLDCSHRFCRECLVFDWKTKINDGAVSLTILVCPEENCKKSINYYTLKANLPVETFEKYDYLLINHTISSQNNENEELNIQKSSEKDVCCPKCHSTFIIDKGASDFTCKKCNIRYCSNKRCYRLMSEHQQPCEFYYGKNTEEKTFEEYMRINNLKRCPVCGAPIEKIKNCNSIHCSSNKCQLKTIFCYLCGELLKEKEIANHYENGSAFSMCKKLLEEQKLIEEQKKKVQITSKMNETRTQKSKEKSLGKNSGNCNRCSQSLKMNHLKILINSEDCYKICFNLSKRKKCNYFCIKCDITMEKVSVDMMISHYRENHLLEIYERAEYFLLLTPYHVDGGKVNFERPTQNHPEFKIYEKFVCFLCDKSLDGHEMIYLNNSEHLPVCGQIIPNYVICKECRVEVSVDSIGIHLKSHKKNFIQTIVAKNNKKKAKKK